MQRLHDRSTSLLTFLSAVLGRVASDLSLDDVELSYLRQHLGRQWRLGRDKEGVKIPPHVDPTESQRHRGVGTTFGEPFEPIVPIDLQHATELGQMFGRTFVLAVLRVDISRHRGARGRSGGGYLRRSTCIATVRSAVCIM